MSGGLDSCAAAFILKKQGVEIFGINMRVTGSADGVQDAAVSAESLGIELHCFDMRREFEKRIIDVFIAEYCAGRTPNPCVLCNRDMKFGMLWEKALALGACALATGHYARIENFGETGKKRIMRGKDASKDQSYFLFTMTQDQLSRTLFPLGGMTKADARKLAENENLRFSERGESQDLCFLNKGSHRDFIRDRTTASDIQPGDIVDEHGQKLGEHQGLYCYTIGQRKGLGNLSGRGYYVIELRPESNQVVAGPESSLLKKHMRVRDVHWTAGSPPDGNQALLVQVRYNSPPKKALVRETGDGSVEVEFNEAERAVTPGQAAVFYRNDEVIGGGWIE